MIRLGSGLYALPLLAFTLESIYGIACWRIFGGGCRLLAAIVVNNLINLPLFFAAGSAPDPTAASAPTNYLAVSVVALEIVVTWLMVCFLPRSSGNSAEKQRTSWRMWMRSRTRGESSRLGTRCCAAWSKPSIRQA
ncbi:MAG: hypothetical protein JO020_30935 [Chloroflexi bacterium]|nr:hypothetical protein [Chloroflexota bacterium]